MNKGLQYCLDNGLRTSYSRAGSRTSQAAARGRTGFPRNCRVSPDIRAYFRLCSGNWKCVFQSHPRKMGAAACHPRNKKPAFSAERCGFIVRNSWCRRRDSNSHSFRHYPLKIACLPISPRRLDHPNKANLAGKSSILSRNFQKRESGLTLFEKGPATARRPHAGTGASACTPSACRQPASERACVSSYSASSSSTAAPRAASNAA